MGKETDKTKKMCPMHFEGIGNCYCIEVGCEWWIKAAGRCSIPVIAVKLEEIKRATLITNGITPSSRADISREPN